MREVVMVEGRIYVTDLVYIGAASRCDELCDRDRLTLSVYTGERTVTLDPLTRLGWARVDDASVTLHPADAPEAGARWWSHARRLIA